jgi:hypothetical protein
MATTATHPPYSERRINVGERRRSLYPAILQAEGKKVSWGGIFGGVLIALGLLLLLTSLGVAVGISAAQPGETEASTLGTGAGIWAGVSLLIALFVGGMVSTRIGAISDRTTGFFEGMLVWVVSILLMLYLAASGVGMVTGGLFNVAGGAAKALGGANIEMSGSVDQILQRLRDPNTAQTIASATGMEQSQVQATLNDTVQRVEANRNNPTQAAAEAKNGVAQLMEQARSSGALERKAEEVKPGATKAAWLTFGALLLSLLTAVLGAMSGRRHEAELRT